jgi:hypothetical protein
VTIDQDQIVYFGKDVDISIVYLGAGSAFRDITKNFVTSEALAKLGQSSTIRRLHQLAGEVRIDTAHTPSYDPTDGGISCVNPGTGEKYHWNCTGLAYGHGSVGDCGKPYLATGGPAHDSVVGIHGGIWSDSIFFSVTPRELIEQGVSLLRKALNVPQSQGPLPPVSLMTTEDLTHTDGYIRVIGKLSPQDADKNFGKTSYRSMPTQGAMGTPARVPTPLHDKAKAVLPEFRKEMYDNMSLKGDRPTMWDHDRDFREAAKFLGTEWRKESMKLGLVPRVVTQDEALNEFEQGSRSVHINTGVGYQWKTRFPGQGKTGVVGVEYADNGKSHFFVKGAEFQAAVDERLELAKQGRIPPDSLWSMKIKPDELRPLEKVRQGKARTIRMPPFDYSLVSTRYHASIRDFLVAGEAKNTMTAMGADPMELWKFLGPEVATGLTCTMDFSNYDDSQPIQFYEMMGIVLEEFYQGSPEDTLVRRTLNHEAAHTVYIWQDEIRQDDHGNPSGYPAGLTTIINCIINILIILVTWRLETGLSWEAFMVWVQLVVMGDDNILTLRKLTEDWKAISMKFNRVSIAATAARLGMVITAADKSLELRPWDEFKEISFLKRGFRLDPDFGWVPAIADETIAGLLDWYKHGGGVGQIKDNLQDALRFAVCHGPAYYEWVISLIQCFDLTGFGIDVNDAKVVWTYYGAVERVYSLTDRTKKRLLYIFGPRLA